MKKIYSLSLFAFFGPFIATFFVALFVLVMQFLWQQIDHLAGKGLEASVILELLVFASANLMPMAIPISVLLSSIMTFGNLAENNELLAYKTTGVPLIRIMWPLTVTVVIISVGAFFFANYAVPKANLKFKSLLHSVKEAKPAMDLIDGVFYSGLEGYSIRVDHKDPDTGELIDVLIYDKSEKRGNVMVTRADRGKMYITKDQKYLVLDLFDGRRYHEMPEENPRKKPTHPHNTLSFETYKIRFDLSSFNFERAREALWKNSTQMMNIKQLSNFVDTTYYKERKKMTYVKDYIKPYFVFDKEDLTSLVTESSMAEDSTYQSTISGVSLNALYMRALSQSKSVRSGLKSGQNELEYQGNRRIGALLEYHKKFTLALACLLLFFIGAPMGAIIRKGGLGLPVVISIVLFVVYYIVMIACEKSAKQGVLTPQAGMWIPVAFITPIALLLTLRANSDSKLVNVVLILQQYLKRSDKKKEKEG